MSNLVAQPPMVHLPPSDRATPFHSAHPSNDKVAKPNSPFSQPISLGRQIQETYIYRPGSTQEHRDTESMSDASTSSIRDAKRHKRFSPTFSQGSQQEDTTLELGHSKGRPRTVDQSPMSTSPYLDRCPPQHNNAPVIYIPPEEDQEDKEENAVWILLWLSLLDPLYSIVGAIYALASMVAIVLLSPLRLCESTCTINRSTVQLLSPILNKHLDMISFPVEAYSGYRAPMLVIIYLFAPLISFGVAIAAWVAASFWGFTLIMGNPDGTERGDDGRNAVLAVRDWWAMYLTKALR